MARDVVTGYCWPQSVGQGERVDLHLSSSGGRPVRVEVARVGARREVVFSSDAVAAGEHETPSDAASKGCNERLNRERTADANIFRSPATDNKSQFLPKSLQPGDLCKLGEDVTNHLGTDDTGLVTVIRAGWNVQHVAGAGLNHVAVEPITDAAGQDKNGMAGLAPAAFRRGGGQSDRRESSSRVSCLTSWRRRTSWASVRTGSIRPAVIRSNMARTLASSLSNRMPSSMR